MSNASRSSKNERRDAAREKAREQRLKQQRREKRNKAVLQLSIGVVILAIVAVVVLVIVNSVRPPGPGPRNMANGGVTISGADLSVVTTPAASAGATPTPSTTSGNGKVLIQAFEDFGCPACRAFETANASQIAELVKSGAAEIQYHPVAILDRNFSDNTYSTRAANAGAVVANYSPAAYYKFHALLYDPDVQPEEGGPGLSDARLVALAKQAGATDMTAIQKGIEDGEFENWVKARSEEFTSDTGALKGVDFSKRLLPNGTQAGPSTPTIIVNGKYFSGNSTDPDAFGSFVTQVGGAYSATPSASPSASPSPSASN